MKRTAFLAIVMGLLLALLVVSIVVAQGGDDDQPELEAARARAATASGAPDRTATGSLEAAQFSYPLFVGVDDVTVDAYQIDPDTNDMLSAFSGVEVWGAAYDYDNQRVYVSDLSTLYVWPLSGAPIPIGTISNTLTTTLVMEGLAYHGGALYASQVSTAGQGEGIYVVDPVSLQATRVISYTDPDAATIGGIDADPVTGQLYGVNDAGALRGLVAIDPDGTLTLIAPYQGGETDVDGLAVGGGKAYLITDDNTPPTFDVFDFGVMTYTAVVSSPWTTSEVFAGGAWIAPPPACRIGGWQSVAPINTPRSRPGMAYSPANHRFYLAGGEATGGNYDNPIEEYDPATGVWTDRVPLLLGVSNTGAAAVGDNVYVPGGYDGVGGVTAMQRYDVNANVVFSMTAMPAPNFAHAVVAYDERIHVLGGNDTGTSGTTHMIYDVATDSWDTGAPLTTAVNYPAAATDGTYIYVLGGNTSNLAVVQRYDPATDTWDTIADMETGRGGAGAFFDGANLWAVGGGWGTYLNSTEYWDGTGWQPGPFLNAGTRTFGLAYGSGMALKAAGWSGAYMDAAEVMEVACNPDIAVAPDEMAVTLTPDEVVTHTLTISNTGAGQLAWDLFEESAPAQGGAAASTNYVRGEHPPSIGPVPAAEAPQGLTGPPVAIPLGADAYSYNDVVGFYTVFDLDVPVELPTIAPFDPSGAFIGAGELYNGRVYMADGVNNMWEVDPATGDILDSYTITQPPDGETYVGFAVDPTDGVVYAASTNVVTSTLFTVDLTTGAATVVGKITNSPAMIAIAVDGAGDLYGYDIVNDEFLRIDKTTGAGTVIGPIGFDANFGQGMAYDPATDTIYLTAFNNGAFRAELRSVDVTTGATSLLGLLGSTTPGGLNHLPWLAFEYSPADVCAPEDLTWLSAAPSAGLADPDAVEMIEVVFDSTGLMPGIYESNLCISSNDPNEPRVRVPVSLTVEPGDLEIFLPVLLQD